MKERERESVCVCMCVRERENTGEGIKRELGRKKIRREREFDNWGNCKVGVFGKGLRVKNFLVNDVFA